MLDALASKALDDPMAPPPCPVPGCSGMVHVSRITGVSAFVCDGPVQHRDTTIRELYVADGESQLALSERELRGMERRCDPAGWVRWQLQVAEQPTADKIHRETLGDWPALPSFATGFVGRERGALLDLRGMTTLSGKASSGKSWFALGAALSSAWDGWDVHYLAAEAHDVIGRRIMQACGERVPERFTLHSAEPGITPRDMIEEIRSWVVTNRTLLVIDSISTLVGLMRYGTGADRWDSQDALEMFLMRVRELTMGDVSIVNISEANAAGETKGRVLDHRSDVSINFKSLEDSDAKEVRVTKAWEGQTGLLGRARVNPDGPGLELVYDGPTAYDGNHEDAEAF